MILKNALLSNHELFRINYPPLSRLLSNLLSYDSIRSFSVIFGLIFTRQTISIFEGCLPQILLGPFLNTLTNLWDCFWIHHLIVPQSIYITFTFIYISFSVYSWLFLPTVSFSEKWPGFKLLPSLIADLIVKISITAALVSISKLYCDIILSLK